MRWLRWDNKLWDEWIENGADRQGNPIWRALQNVKIDFIDFVDENTNVDDNEYNFAFMDYRDQFRYNQS
jgi:hypothetical protein